MSSSKISIADLLEIVKKHYPNDLPEDVAKKLGYKREKSDLKGLKYSINIDDSLFDALEETYSEQEQGDAC